jgi:hypothetical protein
LLDEAMPESQRTATHAQTYLVEADNFSFDTLEHDNGRATVIQFKIDDARYHAGDVVLVLSGTDIHFHGMIGKIAAGWAIATDRRGSLLPATVQ